MIGVRISMGINTKKQLKHYIKLDIQNSTSLCGKKIFFEYIKGNYDVWVVYRFLIALRKMEYYSNNQQGIKSFFYLVYKHYFKRLQQKYQLFISPNVFQEGLHIVHPGYIWVDNSSCIGKNCTILPRVLLGKKRPGITPPCIKIGDDCYIGTGSTILGPVNIGNNVTIAAGSVVIDDIPDNCIVAGNPAKIKKYKR